MAFRYLYSYVLQCFNLLASFAKEKMLQNRYLDVELGTPYMVHPKYCILIQEVGLEKKLNNYRAV